MSDGKARLTDTADARWQWALLALCALGFFFVATSIYVIGYLSADIGLTGERTDTPPLYRITVSPGGDAARSGLQSGDLVDVSQLDPAARFRLFDGPRPNEPIVFIVRRGSQPLRIAVVPRSVPPVTWNLWLLFAGMTWITFFCTLLAWRRSNSPAVRALVLYLLLTLVVSQGFGNVVTPWPWFDFFCLQVKGVLFPFGFAFIALYAEQFARPVSATRRGLTIFAFAMAGLSAAIAQWFYVSVARGQIDFFQSYLLIRAVPLARFSFVVLLGTALATLLVALRAARGEDRTRLLWGISGIVPFAVWTIVSAVAGTAIPFVVFGIVASIFWFGTPAVLTYSLLNKRLFDIGFIVNRAAVFTGVSLVVLGTFVLVEWLLSDWLRDASHTTNVLVSGGLALALGLSIRFLHGRIDRAVDNVFFRKRHEDEEAIRTFAHEAPYISDRASLIERAIAVLSGHTNASSVDILLSYDENDPAIVRLRATPQVLDLHGVDTALAGDLAFPMTTRGRLVGVVVLGPRASDEKYAPDETAAIAQLAHSVAASLDVLTSRNGESYGIDRVVASIQALREEIVRRLPAIEPESAP